jgi:hypothetical protein
MAKQGRLSRQVERASANVRGWSSYPQQSSTTRSKSPVHSKSGATQKQKAS